MKYKVSEGWEEVKLGEIINLTMGQSPKSEYYNEKKEGTPFLQGNSTFGIKYPEIERYTTKVTRLAKKGDILMSVRAPVGDLNISNKDICIGRGLCSMRMLNGQQEFLYYLMKYYVSELKNRESGTVFSSINKKDIETLPIILPPLQEQKAIADTLSAIDDKIELNNKINQNLEAQAQAIFKSWFIDFEPFQDGEFVESELGMIPKGWEIKKLQDIVIENRRGISPKYNDNDVGIPVINQRCIRNYQVIEEEIKYHDNSVLEARDVYYLKPYDILINSMGVGTLGRVAQISNPAKEMLVHSCITILRADIKVVTSTYLGYAVKSKQSIIEQMGSGSTGQTSLKKSDLENLNFIIAPIEIQKKVDGLFENILIEKDILHKQNQKLSQLRDTLLPKLISGEIRIPLDK